MWLLSLSSFGRTHAHTLTRKHVPSVSPHGRTAIVGKAFFCCLYTSLHGKGSGKVCPLLKLIGLCCRTYKFSIRAPSNVWFLLRAARCPMGSDSPGHASVGNVTLKEVSRAMVWGLVGQRSSLQLCGGVFGLPSGWVAQSSSPSEAPHLNPFLG